MAPTAIFVVASIVLIAKNILTWKDPLGKMIEEQGKETAADNAQA